MFLTYWQTVAKRSELLSIALYDGVIGKTDFLPFASKPGVGTREFDDKTAAEKSGDPVLRRSGFLSSIPLIMQRTYVLPQVITAAIHTKSGRGLTNKQLVVVTDSGELVPLDLRMIHPRRPMADPTPAEKEEGLSRYSPLLMWMPPMLISGSAPLPSTAEGYNIQTAGGYMESESLLLVHAIGGDLLLTKTTPSQGFDTLSADFNYAMLVALIAALGGAVSFLRHMHNKVTLNRLWA